MKKLTLMLLAIVLTQGVSTAQTIGDSYNFIKRVVPNGELLVDKNKPVFFYKCKDDHYVWTYVFDSTKECIGIMINPKAPKDLDYMTANFNENWKKLTSTTWTLTRKDNVVLSASISMMEFGPLIVLSKVDGWVYTSN